MRQTRLVYAVVVAIIECGAVSCGDTTSPASRALDGAWTTGHACLSFGLDLTWTDSKVSGSGGYRTDIGPVDCVTPASLTASGTVTVDARRTSSSTLSGSMIFDARTRATFTGTLDATGGARINGTVVTPDGVSSQVTLFEGLVP